MKYVNRTTNEGKVVKLKNYKKRAKINRIKRKILLIFLIIFAVILLLTHAPFMKISKINCYGNIKITSEDIVSASKICIGNNIFRVNKNKAISQIKSIPYIKDVKIDRKLPSTMNINVTECEISAYVILNKSYIYLDDDGKILEESDVIPDIVSPEITGVKINEHQINEYINLKNEKQLDAYREIIKTTNGSQFKNKITQINLKNLQDIRIIINNSLEIIIGDVDNLDYKVNFLASGAYDSIGDNRPGILDVSYGSKAVYKETINE